jgi:hypothetical protein
MTRVEERAEMGLAEWYGLVRDILEAQAEAYSSSKVHVLLSYVYLERLQNKYRSIYHLNKA